MTTAPYRLAMSPAARTDDQARRCELDVLARWYGDTRELLEEAYGPYEPQSVFLSVTRDDGVVVGVCRVITPGALPLKTISDIAGEPWTVDAPLSLRLAGIDPDRTWDIATIAVRSELGAGGSLAANALYYGLIRGTRVNGIPWVSAIIDRRARSLLAMLGLPLNALPGTAPAGYMGSTACASVWTHVPTVVEQQRHTNPEGYRLVSLGLGLTQVHLPADEDLRVQPRPPVGADRRHVPVGVTRS